MTTETFAHGISRVDVVGGMVRLELFTLVPVDGQGEATATPVSVVIMPMDGFLRAFGTQDNLVQQLIKAGVVTRNENGATKVPKAP